MKLEQPNKTSLTLAQKASQLSSEERMQWRLHPDDSSHPKEHDQSVDVLPPKVNLSKIGGRKVEISHDGGVITSDAGITVFAEQVKRSPFFENVLGAFTDERDQSMVAHPLRKLIMQYVLLFVAGYEDQNDSDPMRSCGVFSAILSEYNGVDRKDTEDVAGRMTLQRLTDGAFSDEPRKKGQKITIDRDKFNQCLLDNFTDYVELLGEKGSKIIVLDADGTFSPLHGEQECGKFNGHKKGYGYMPEMFFCERHLLSSELRNGTARAGEGTLKTLKRIVRHLREKCPEKFIIIRADGEYPNPDIINWCDKEGIGFLFGITGYKPLEKEVADLAKAVEKQSKESGESVTEFKEFRWEPAIGTWNCDHRIVAKVEHLNNKNGETLNTRFVVTNLGPEFGDARHMYEEHYSKRGHSENMIREHQSDLFGKRMSCHKFTGNEIRLIISAIAYTLVNEFRRIALAGTKLAEATWRIIRLKLIKIGARVVNTNKEIKVKMSSENQDKELFNLVCQRVMKYRKIQT